MVNGFDGFLILFVENSKYDVCKKWNKNEEIYQCNNERNPCNLAHFSKVEIYKYKREHWECKKTSNNRKSMQTCLESQCYQDAVDD